MLEFCHDDDMFVLLASRLLVAEKRAAWDSRVLEPKRTSPEAIFACLDAAFKISSSVI